MENNIINVADDGDRRENEGGEQVSDERKEVEEKL